MAESSTKFFTQISHSPGAHYNKASITSLLGAPPMSIRDFLQNRHVRFETLLHCPAPSATKRAQSIHVSGRSVAKVVLIRAAEQHVLVVLPATHRIEFNRLAQVLGVKEV